MVEWESLLAVEGGLSSPVYDPHGRLHVASTEAGQVIRIDIAGEAGAARASTEPVALTDGAPTGVAFDATGALFVADTKHRAILSRAPEDEGFGIMVDSYEGKPLSGPSSVATDGAGNLYFTDGGVDGESGLAKPVGSLFCVNVDNHILKPMLMGCLAQPTGVAVSADGKVVYLAEGARNQIIRLIQRPDGVYIPTVFKHLSGGIGPTALATNEAGMLFVCRSEHDSLTETTGFLSVFDKSGAQVAEVALPGPCCNGVAVDESSVVVSETSKSVLYRAQLSNILKK